MKSQRNHKKVFYERVARIQIGLGAIGSRKALTRRPPNDAMGDEFTTVVTIHVLEANR